MRCQRQRLYAGLLLVPIALFLGSSGVHGQVPGNQLPNPRLFTVVPPGGQQGKIIEVTFTGSDLDEPQSMLFSHPGLKAEPIKPPAPPADPKKPPMPPPPITKFKVTIAPNTPLGIHDVRLINKWGISNPRAFIVGDLPEVYEKEPNNDVHEAQRVEMNTTIHGALASPTDVDYYAFTGKTGQRVIVSCLASSIDSRLDAAIELYDRDGRQLASGRHYEGTDALLDCSLPADGEYFIRVYEFTYTLGSAEHFYRLTISTTPWIDAIYPPMIEPGKPATVTIYGRNLPNGQPDPTAKIKGRILEKTTVTIAVPADPLAMQRLNYSGMLVPAHSGLDGFEFRTRNPSGFSNPFLLMYARAPVVLDNEANDTAETAQEVPLPCEIAGRIEKKRDRDWYAFTAKQGQVYSIELFSGRFGAPTDMYFHLWNATTKQDLGEFDDNPEILSQIKFFTHTGDPPRYRFVAPADGKYHLMVTSHDADARASPRHLYRVSIRPEQPDFRVIVMSAEDDRPDACQLYQGGHQAFTVLVWRQDGFNGNITLTAEGLPTGVTCPPQSMGTGMILGNLVVSAAPAAPLGIYDIKVKATATINGKPVVHEARPASIVWPNTPGAGIPALSRLDRNLMLAVRDKAPYSLAATIDKATIVQGDQAKLTVNLARLWPDANTPLTVAVDPTVLPPNLVINNNQPITINPGATTGALPIVTNPMVLPGTYTIVLRTSTPIPYTKDIKVAQKMPVSVAQPSAPVTLTILPKQVATLTVPAPNITAKVGSKNEVVVKLARMYDFAGEFKVQLVLPANIQGVSAAELTIPAGQEEGKLVLQVAANAAPGNRPDLIIRATALVNGNVPTIHEAKISVNVEK